MKINGDSITRRLLTLVVMALLTLTFLGCNDPMVKKMEAQRQEVGFLIEQELQRCRIETRQSAQARSLPEAQVADMEAERRELERMVQRGEWDSLAPQQSTSQRTFSHPKARAVDMEAERRELERMIERGDYSRISPMPSTAQSDLFYQAP
ncbi:MAG: hypothetical protein JXM79_09255 [Sedimentisphaerales bacterium]|nr:hypothetical protein [Sedimentisphaerales bacterium]